MTQLFPSIIPDSESAFVDDSYSRAELERMEWDEIRHIAASVETDAINGQSEREHMEDVLTGHTRL
jgi:hypothetical protein